MSADDKAAIVASVSATLRWVEHQVEFGDFESGGRVHNWGNYVPQAIRDRWQDLSTEARFLIVCVAEQAANKEEWD